jgi:hypothetical protein
MWRMGRDSNPRYLSVHTLSRRARSTALAPIRNEPTSLLSIAGACNPFVTAGALSCSRRRGVAFRVVVLPEVDASKSFGRYGVRKDATPSAQCVALPCSCYSQRITSGAIVEVFITAGVETSWATGVASFRTPYRRTLSGVDTPLELRKRNATPLRLGQDKPLGRQTCNLKQQKCYLCIEPNVLPMS